MQKAVDVRAREILSRIGTGAIGVEVGVFRGGLSSRLLRGNTSLYLNMVDSWTVGDDNYKESGDYHATLTQADQDAYYLDSLKNTEFAKDRRRVLRMGSVEAARQFEDGSLDFVFIDADHSYKGCAADIEAWRPKLKPTGLLCGHDYNNIEFPGFGVKQAVDEMVSPIELGGDTTWFSYDTSALTVVCVKWGDKYGAEYVNNLRTMVSKNLIGAYRFVCMTDDPTGLECDTIPLPGNLYGWWNKVYLFKPDLFTGKVMYLDLDVCITGNLAPFLATEGIINDWHLPTYNSSVMVWNSGEHTDIWEKFNPVIATMMHGDQDWITELGGWDCFPPEWCVSYRGHARNNPPENAKVVCFHGEPKPHEYPSQWVGPIWHGKTLITGYESKLNTAMATMIAQSEQNLQRNLPIFIEQPENSGTAIIVGGGPSLADSLTDLRLHHDRGGIIFALNGTHDYLIERGIIPEFHGMLDARPDNAKFVRKPHKAVNYLIASQCHPDVFDALDGYQVTQWTACCETQEQDNALASKFPNIPLCLIGGGATVGLKTMNLAYLWGFRKFRLYGMDSSYSDGENHAYRQELNDSESRMDIHAAGRDFICAPWMAKQAAEFQRQYRQLIELGCKIKVCGDGLIPHIYKQLEAQNVV